MSKHTMEPWEAGTGRFAGRLYGRDPAEGPNAKRLIADFNVPSRSYDPERQEADIQRAAACVNVFAGVEDPKTLLESYWAMAEALDSINNWKYDGNEGFDPHEDLPAKLYEEVLGALNTYVKLPNAPSFEQHPQDEETDGD